MDRVIISLMVACLLAVAAQHASSSSDVVQFTEVANATDRRAVCMDGTPGGYYYSAGAGGGAKNWVLYLQGGGWCEDISSCQFVLTNASSGSSNYRLSSNSTPFTGILSSDKLINPDFYNWNRIYVQYCDQSSFLGDTEIDGPGYKFQFRGSRIFDAVVEDLLAKGMGVGENAILSGRSAGALATILHCDGFRARLPGVGRVKCLSDAGFFIRAENVSYASYREHLFASTITFHNISSLLPAKCTEKIDPSLCLFPENLVGGIQTPIFLLNSAFDQFQVQYRLVPRSSPCWEKWNSCVTHIGSTNCTTADKQLITDFGDAFFKTVREIPNNPSRGMFIDACFIHSVAYIENYWSRNSTVKLENLTIQEAFANWYFDRSESVRLINSTKYLVGC